MYVKRIKRIKIAIILYMILFIVSILFMYLSTQKVHAFTPPPNTLINSTSIVDVGLLEEHISFTKEDGAYGLDGLPIYGFWSYANGDLEGSYNYLIWSITQPQGTKFELYISNVLIEFDSPIYFVRYNHNAEVTASYLTFHAIDNSLLQAYAYSGVNSTWEIKRYLPYDDIQEQLQNAFNRGESDGYIRGRDDYRYYDVETDTYYTAEEWGSRMYELGLGEGDFSWLQTLWYIFTLPFQIFAIDLMPGTGLYVGLFALMTLVLGIIGFLFAMRGKK